MHITLYACSVIAVRHLVQHDICYAHNVIVFRCLIQHKVVATELLTTYLSTIATSKRICNYGLIMPHLAYFFVIETYARRGVLAVHFLLQWQLSGKYRWIYLRSFNIRQLTALLKHDRSWNHTSAIHHQNCLPSSQIATYIFCSNYWAFLCIIAIASYIAI